MKIVVKATETQRAEFVAKGIPEGTEILFYAGEKPIPAADAYIDFCYEEEGQAFATIEEKPVFVNAVIDTTEMLNNNCCRINAWNGFFSRDTLEICLPSNASSDQATTILAALGWKYRLVADIPGMIAARIVAMIINEAYFGLGDGISSKAGMDTAMKLGTNYPHGPFEWAGIIGLHKIYGLLERLSQTDARYSIAPALLQEMEEKK